MRLVFLGSPAFAVPSLEALLAAGHQVGLVISQPDRPAGRGRQPSPPPVVVAARQHDLPVWQTSSVRGEAAEARIRAVEPEAMALAAFAALIPNTVLDIAPLGILNVHPSLLPRWRGAAPIQAALLAGDQETGVSIIRLVQALDAGPVLLQERVPIRAEDDYLGLEPRLAELGAHLLVQALAERPPPMAQDEAQATFSRRIERDDGRIDWAQPAEQIWRQVRALRGWPQAFTGWQGRLLKILRAWPLADGQAGEAGDPGNTRDHGHAPPGTVRVVDRVPVVATGQGGLRLDEVVLEGRKPQAGTELLRGYRGLVGSQLGDPPL